MFKKLTAAALAVVLTLGAAALPMADSGIDLTSITASAETWGDYTYTVYGDGYVEITGYRGTDTKISIPSIIDGKKVTRIGDLAFYDCSKLTSINIPYGVTSIGGWTFSYCQSLTNITMPNSIASIGEKAFYYCRGLSNITIPNSVTSIGLGAFGDCTSLTSITIPDSVTSIGDGTFGDCKSLTSITIPDSVKSIGGGAFFNCSSLTNIIIPNSVTYIGNGAFSHTPWLTKKQKENPLVVVNGILIDGTTCKGDIVIPDGVTSIGDHAFEGCSSLTNIIIPNSVTSIGDYAFHWCSNLSNVTIPDSVISIGERSFGWCENLKSITIPNSVTDIDEDSFYGCNNVTIYCYSGSAAEKYAKEYNIEYKLIDISKVFIYDDPNVFVADGLLNRAVMPGGDIMPSVGDIWAFRPTQSEFIYEQIGKEISENTVQYGSALFWQNLEKYLKGDFVGMAYWQEIMYESLIIDYLAYNGESEEFKSDFNEKATSFAKDITDELAEKGINNLDILSLEDAKKYAKTIKWSKRLSNYNDILSDVTDFATTGFDYYEKLSKALAVNQVNEERIAFLKEIKNNSTDQHLNNAVDKVIGYYESSIADTAFKYNDDYATRFLVERSWSEFISDASKACPAIGEATSFLKLGTAGFDWLFNTDDVSSAMLESEAIYNMGVYAEIAYQKSRDSYSNSGKVGVPGDSEKAKKFVGSYENYIIFKNYANTIVDKYLYERLCEGMHGSIPAAIQDILTYSYWSSAIDSEKTSSNIWLSMMNSYRDYYYTFSGYNTPNAHTHTYDSGKVTKAATCTSTGVKTYTCTNCGATKTETIAKTSHKYDSGKVTKAATYSSTGTKTYTCKVCGAKKTSSIARKAIPKLTGKTNFTYTTNAVRINWNKISGVTGYKIFRYDDAKKTWVAIKTIYDPNATNYKISGLSAGKVYKFRVKAFVKSGSKVYYGDSCNTISTATRPNTTKITKSNKASTAVRLYWNKTTCSGYRIEKYDSAKKKWVRVTAVGSPSTTQYRISGLKKNTTYKFRIQPYVKVGSKVIYGTASAAYTVKTTK